MDEAHTPAFTLLMHKVPLSTYVESDLDNIKPRLSHLTSKHGTAVREALCTMSHLLLLMGVEDHDCSEVVAGDSHQCAVAVPTAVLTACKRQQQAW